MKAYHIRLRPLSSWGTPWRAATLFGSLCWLYRLKAGEGPLLKWLEAFRDGDPPFVLSDPFPGGYLPLPVGVMPVGEEKVKPPLLVNSTEFRRLASSSALQAEAVGLNSLVAPADRLQASIGRISGIANEESGGALFEVEQESFTARAPGYFSLYFRTGEAVLPIFWECLSLLSYRGYGRDSSTGVGAFAIDGEPEACAWMDEIPGANGFVALSHFVPSESDPRDGYWRLHTSYPKFHGSAVAHPFKGSLVALAPGSRFRTDGLPKPWYGRMLPVPRPGMDRALHYGLCFAAPVVMS